MTVIARRYARAAVDAAAEKAQDAGIDTLAAGLRKFREAYASAAELREVLQNPAFRRERTQVLQAVIARLGLGEGPAANLIRLLEANGRMTLLNDVVAEIDACIDERRGCLRATVVSAIALTPAQEKRVAAALEKRLGHAVAVRVEVDPTLLGGLVCQVGDLIFDSSLKRQLELLRERLEVHNA